jgi:hypothetical protein
MSIVLPSLAVAFAALCVWLGVRVFNRRERWAKWTAAVALVVAFVVYPLSAGPFVWLYDRGYISDDVAGPIWYAYLPIIVVMNQSDWSRGLVEWYLSFWRAEAGED